MREGTGNFCPVTITLELFENGKLMWDQPLSTVNSIEKQYQERKVDEMQFQLICGNGRRVVMVCV